MRRRPPGQRSRSNDGRFGGGFRWPLALLLSLVTARANVTFSSLFSDHAVLQRDKPVSVWGRADPGEPVTVTFRGQSVGATADAAGRWTVILDAIPVQTEGADLAAAGKNRIVARDVVVGEVWLCSGQSNMEFVLRGPESRPGLGYRVEDADAEVATARYPLIRQYRVPRRVSSAPQADLGGAWQCCSPETAAGFTAVGYFFARTVVQKLGVPVGLVNSAYAGTPIEAWMSAAAFASSPGLAAIRARERSGGSAVAVPGMRSPPLGSPSQPEGLFNGMVAPLIPYGLRGILWYQGESNAERAGEYRALFPAMIAAWREQFGQGDLPFYFVQLANFAPPGAPGRATWAYLREAQAEALSLPQTGMAVAIDLGDPRDIHPRNKQEVGRRLAAIALVNLYGLSGDVSGPQFAGIEPAGAALRVRFDYAQTGLITHDRPVQSLEIAGADRIFHPASGRIDGETLLVSSPLVPHPVAVRYAWADAPVANLYNGAGLPAAPFRSDRW
jgi:sialate O-acetylesterase